MGRKSALSPEDWATVEHRHVVGGESINSLAREYCVNESSIRRRLAEKAKTSDSPSVREELHTLAVRKARVEQESKKVSAEIAALPAVRQMIVTDLAKKLVAVSNHMASSAEYMSATTHRLSAIANGLMDKIDEAEPLKSSDIINQAAALIRLANDTAHVPLNLLRANQATLDAMNKPEGEDAPAGLDHFYGS